MLNSRNIILSAEVAEHADVGRTSRKDFGGCDWIRGDITIGLDSHANSLDCIWRHFWRRESPRFN